MTLKNKTGTTAATARRRRASAKTKKGTGGIANFFVPVFFIFCILFCLGFLTFMGYRTAAASSFFDIEKVEVRGNKNIDGEEIERIVRSHTAKTGVWNADLEAIKKDLKKFRYAKNISVSRILPDSIQVVVDERVPRAVVRLDGGKFWVDEDARVLSPVSDTERNLPFAMLGWSREKTEKAAEDNKNRVELYLKLRADWTEFDLASRVSAVNLSDPSDPQAIVTDSGRDVVISLGRSDYKKNLQKALEVIAGRGDKIETVITSGANPIVGYRESQETEKSRRYD